MKKILVTGGAGYIGSNLVDVLLEQGSQVVVIDNLSTGKRENIHQHLSNSNFTFIEETILNEKLMDELIGQVDQVYHLAAAVGVKYIVDTPLEGILTNVRGSEIVFKLALQHAKPVLFTSTSEIYGKSKALPFKEDGERVLGPTTVARWSYSTAKALDEHLAFAYHGKGLAVSVIRYFNSYGPRVDIKGYGSVIAQFIRQALKGEPLTIFGDGKQTRCFTYVSDTIAGTLLAANKENAGGQVFNVGNDEEISIIELAKMIKRLTATQSKLEVIPYEKYYGKGYEDTRRRVPDISLAKKEIGYKPRVGLEEGLKKTIAWFKEFYQL